MFKPDAINVDSAKQHGLTDTCQYGKLISKAVMKTQSKHNALARCKNEVNGYG